jgi:hypothetical protein
MRPQLDDLTGLMKGICYTGISEITMLFTLVSDKILFLRHLVMVGV